MASEQYPSDKADMLKYSAHGSSYYRNNNNLTANTLDDDGDDKPDNLTHLSLNAVKSSATFYISGELGGIWPISNAHRVTKTKSYNHNEFGQYKLNLLFADRHVPYTPILPGNDNPNLYISTNE